MTANNVNQLDLPLNIELDTNGSSNFNDPAFSSNKTLPVHRWVPWIAGYSSDFVNGVIKDENLSKNSLVLDPFAGVGTTLVESMKNELNTIGFEINPYAAFATRTKTQCHKIDSNNLENAIRQFKVTVPKWINLDIDPQSSPPRGFNTRSEFYSTKVLKKVLLFFDFVNDLHQNKIVDLFKLAFASTMIKFSNYSYEPSLGTRKAAGKPEIDDFPVIEYIHKKLLQMLEDIRYVNSNYALQDQEPRVINDSFFQYEKYLKEGSIDLLITSPPYLNNYHYNRNTRPHLYWLDFVQSPSEMKPIEHSNYGKFWQTVRNKENIELDFHLPSSDLEDKLEALKAKNHEKGVYGGNGWANYAITYFNDSLKFMKGIQYALKKGSKAYIVIGNSILQGINIRTDKYIGEIANLIGLDYLKNEVPRATRTGNSIIDSQVRSNKSKNGSKLYEAIVVIGKS